MKYSYIYLAVVLLLISCKKDSDNINPNLSGSLVVEFDNIVGSDDLTLSTTNYTNELGQEFNVTALNYYISNIKLQNADGSEYVYPKDASYFLIKESDEASRNVILTGIPEGDYTGITFTIGVDSTKSVSDISERTGVLDPANGAMYWSWNVGYIFMMMEGTSPQSSNAQKALKYHIGLYGGYDPNQDPNATPRINNVKIRTLAFNNDKAQVRQKKQPTIHLTADVKKLFTGTENVDFASTPIVMVSQYSKTIANNYTEMFQYAHLHHDNVAQ